MTDNDAERRPSNLAQTARDIKLDTPDSRGGSRFGTPKADVAETPNNGSRFPFANGPNSPWKTTLSNSHQSLSNPIASASVAQDREGITDERPATKMENTDNPATVKSMPKKASKRPSRLYLDYEDVTAEATRSFEVISDCIYANKHIGGTDSALECDCSEEWDVVSQKNLACGEDSDCINRLTKMECTGTCACGPKCQNRRFQRRSYAKVSVIKTELKGYGLRADRKLSPNEMVFEYIGEVIGENAFQNRRVQYDQQKIKHFYFMSLNKGEYIDATKKGNLGRFCNHSCRPNCYVDKWVVGKKLRMGIFAQQTIDIGEELVFNYNVDRYGADPQKCYCGEDNCSGFLGGKTQTERATKLSADTIEALGIDDADAWDASVAAKKHRKKKVGEDDGEYIDSLSPRTLDERAATKVMASLMQCKEKWLIIRLLDRILRCDEERVLNRVVRMHGYQILNSTLSAWIDDNSIVMQLLGILNMLPRLTRNKIQDSKIEETVKRLVDSEEELVRSTAAEILTVWNNLEMGYRIPRMKRDPNALAAQEREERRRLARDRSKSRSRSSSPDLQRAPTGPKAGNGPRSLASFHSRPSFRRAQPASLPNGWYEAKTPAGRPYYYSQTGERTWQRPSLPVSQPPPPPPKAESNQQKLQEIIDSITRSQDAPKEKSVASTGNQPKNEEPIKREKRKDKQMREKWKSYPLEKQKKIYENTLNKVVMSVVKRYSSKLERGDVKRFAKEVTKTLVNSDFKHGRVEDPHNIPPKLEKQAKKFVNEYFQKAVSKKQEYERKRADRRANQTDDADRNRRDPPTVQTDSGSIAVSSTAEMREHSVDNDPEAQVELTDNEISEDEPSPSTAEETTSELKRKRDAEDTPMTGVSPADEIATLSKRVKSDSPPPPPPPPPPPAEDFEEEDQFMDYEGVNSGEARAYEALHSLHCYDTSATADSRIDDEDAWAATVTTLDPEAAQNAASDDGVTENSRLDLNMGDA